MNGLIVDIGSNDLNFTSKKLSTRTNQAKIIEQNLQSLFSVFVSYYLQIPNLIGWICILGCIINNPMKINEQDFVNFFILNAFQSSQQKIVKKKQKGNLQDLKLINSFNDDCVDCIVKMIRETIICNH
ncbi:hypothetical protein QR98_0056760 [Sarcoptes scabiei]|uniref:Uncharacterized protein n=1 Tax=Sarcoptes scabiei TaxID=52283 RepID=A0A132A9R7_SARSC|nr:hypothetical protein QR98_0056760 [Sarcoptes scabiei]